jgi:hypothetical protein
MPLDFTFTTPTTAIGAGTPSRALASTLTGSGVLGSTASIALSDGGAGGTFFPASVSIASGQTVGAKVECVYIPAAGATGLITLTATCTGGVVSTKTLQLPIATNATVFVRDPYTGSSGTALESHVPSVGGSWVRQSSGQDGLFKLTGAGAIYNAFAPSSVTLYYNTATANTAEFDVQCDWIVHDSTALAAPFICSDASHADGPISFYGLTIYNDPSVGGWYASKDVADVQTTFFGPIGTPPAPGTYTGLLAIRLINGNQYIFGIMNGALLNPPIQDNTLAVSKIVGVATNSVGTTLQTPTSGNALSNLTARNVDWSVSSLASGTVTKTPGLTSVDLSTTVASGGVSPYNYQFQRSAHGANTWVNIGPNSTTRTYTDTGLANDTIYDYRCMVTDNVSATANSGTIMARTTHAATTYYVATSGSDSANGTTVGTPWATIGKVNSWVFVPGDSLLFNGGDSFAGELIWVTSGIQSARCTISWYGIGQPTIMAPDTANGIRLFNCEFVRVTGLGVAGSGVASDGTTTSGTQPPPTTNPWTPTIGSGIFIYSTVTSRAQRWRTVLIDSCTVTGCQFGMMIQTPIGTQTVVGYSDLRITNCSLHDNQLIGISVWGGGPTMQNVGSNFPAGLTTHTGVYIAKNHVYNTRQGGGIQIINTTGGVVERNAIHDCGQPTSAALGGLVFAVCDSIVGQYNECYGIRSASLDGLAFDCDDAAKNCIMQYNYSHDNDGAGFANIDVTSGNSGNIFRYNISRGDARTNEAGLYVYGPASAIFHNNTVYGAGSAFKTDVTTSSKLYNNIFFTTGGAPITSGTLTGTSWVGNLYYTTGGALSIGGFSSLAAWQGSGQETFGGILYGVNADPLLSNPTIAGTGTLPAVQVNTITAFDIAAGSPARGAAIDMTILGLIAGPSDYHGYPTRVAGAAAGPDVGAVTYGAVALMPATAAASFKPMQSATIGTQI